MTDRPEDRPGPQPPIVIRRQPDQGRRLSDEDRPRLALPDLLRRVEARAREHIAREAAAPRTLRQYENVARLAAELRAALEAIDD